MKTNTPVKERIISRKKFLYYFPKGFADAKYYSWERGYKWEAHLAWERDLNKEEYEKLLSKKEYMEIALRAVRLETKTNLLFSFEKMALRDAVKSEEGAKAFANGLYEYVYGKNSFQKRFEKFSEVLDSLPRKPTRVRTWPLQTVFGFMANPKEHIFLKPRVTQAAAKKYNYEFIYRSKPNWETYKSLLDFAEQVRKDTADLKPKDFIDLQSFIWVLGSEEYDD
ncbi:MAG: hypothetical protein JWN83_452 [Chitinophagaceae bacterium]|nr:hypothetical protein [Chitinophagaceae bacterium]